MDYQNNDQPAYQQPVYQQPVYQQPIYQQPMAPVKPGNGCAIASMVIGIISAAFVLLACAVMPSWASLSLGALALILSFVGIGLGIPGIILGAKRKSKLPHAIVGLCLSLIALILYFAIIAALASVVM